MRLETFQKLNAEVQNFKSQYCRYIELKDIECDEDNSQVRANGHVVSMVPSYAETFRAHGLDRFPPITVQPIPNGKFKIRDGNTRYLAAKIAGQDKILASTYHFETQHPNESEWEDLQMIFNDHPKSSPNALEDIAKFLMRQQNSGDMTLKVGFTYDSDPKQYIADAGAIYKSLLPNSGKNLNWWKNSIRKTLEGHVVSTLQNYTKQEAFEFYKDITGFSGERVGDISGGTSVYVLSRHSNINPNIIGALCCKEVDNPGTKYVIVSYISDTPGMKPSDFITERNKVRQTIQKFSDYWKLNVEVKFLPQIKTGPLKESMHKFVNFEVSE